jgi:hypothetical protein
VEAGHLLLFVRVNNATEEAKAKKILAARCNFDVTVVSVPNDSKTDTVHQPHA